MKKDSFKTVVIFRQFKGEIIALFPYIKENNGLCMSYMHIGQHSAASYSGVMSDSIPVNSKEYDYLLKELKSIGYNLKIQLRALKRKM
jgi:hypothetical protein